MDEQNKQEPVIQVQAPPVSFMSLAALLLSVVAIVVSVVVYSATSDVPKIRELVDRHENYIRITAQFVHTHSLNTNNVVVETNKVQGQ